MTQANKIAFVTGATGFIGSRVVKKLCASGWTVHAVVRNKEKGEGGVSQWPADIPRNIYFTEVDLFKGPTSERMRIFSSVMKGATACFHIAEAKTREKNFDISNIKTIEMLLEVARQTPELKCFVFVSAFMAGGLPHPLPSTLTEEMTGTQFPDPYYFWKRAAELLLIRAAEASHFSYSIIRPALVYGPRAEWLKKMLAILKRFGKFGIPLPNGGTAFLGTVHVEDVSNVIALSGSNENAKDQIIHAADEGGTTYRDWFNEISKASGWEIRVRSLPKGLVFGGAKIVDVISPIWKAHYGAKLWAEVLSKGCRYSNEKMKSIIGPLHYPTIREGVPTMVDWFVKQK
jgi:nucleoside-diphosphate-sugar epimerase